MKIEIYYPQSTSPEIKFDQFRTNFVFVKFELLAGTTNISQKVIETKFQTFSFRTNFVFVKFALLPGTTNISQKVSEKTVYFFIASRIFAGIGFFAFRLKRANKVSS